MIDKMTKYSFVLLGSDKESFLEQLQNLGLVDITRSSKPVDEHSTALLSRIEAQKGLIKDIEAGEDEHLRTLNMELSELQASKAEIAPWGDYDKEKLAALALPMHYYIVESKRFDPAWEQSYALQEVAEQDGKKWFVIVGDNEDFPIKEIPAPSMTLSEIEADIEAKQGEIASYSKDLAGRKDEVPALKDAMTGLQDELSRYLASVQGEGAAEDHLIVFEGFAPKENETELEAKFNDMDLVWFSDKAQTEDNPPIKLKNNKFVSMFEVLTDMYGRPAYNEFDPTVFISIFFMLFFAFCMGDMGYGLILIALGLGLKKALGKLSPLVISLGVATTIIGFLFHTFFSMDISQWDCIPDFLKKIMLPSKIAGYDGTMVLALIVGVIHLCTAMIVKTYISTKQNGFKNSLATWGWTLLIVGGVIVGAFALFGVLDKAVTKWIIIGLGIISALGIFFLNNLKRNPLINFGAGLWDTYGMVTGLLGDVLSYLRLYALGLAGGMLGYAFNDLGKMCLGDGHFGVNWLFFILIVVIGHVLNFAMAALGAFVHPLRLNFLEFFKNAGYEGSGRKYKPLAKSNNQ